MNTTTKKLLQLQQRIDKLEAALSALGISYNRGENREYAIANPHVNNLVATRPVPERWLTAREVGEILHRSPSWVKQHSSMLPGTSMKRGARRSNLYLWNDNTQHLLNTQL